MEEKNKIVQKSVGLEKRHLDFIKYTKGKTFEIGDHKVIFEPDKFFRDVMDLQIKIISKKYPDVKKFL